MRFSKKAPPQDFDSLPVDSVNIGEEFSSPAAALQEQEKLIPKATIGPKICLKGELSGEEDIQIDGHMEGSIHLVDHTVSIGVHGFVESSIKARSVVTEGVITGDVEALDIITVRCGSNVHGNLKSDRIQLDEGAKFWGGIDMTQSAQVHSSPHSGG